MKQPFFHRLAHFLVILSGVAALSSVAQARPEYAVSGAMNRCTTCHLLPTGGGARSITGKAFGYRGYSPGPFASQDLVSADVRMIYFEPEEPDENKGGAGVMVAEVQANVPLVELSEEQSEIRLVAAHNIGGFNSASYRPTYLRIMRYMDGETSLLPQYILIGRIPSPFGVAADEHRTYTKMQVTNTWYDLNTGFMLSSNIVEALHYDIALLNGQNNQGDGFGDGRARLWGSAYNLRWMPSFLPLGVGASHASFKRKDAERARANAVYAMLSVGRLTGMAIPLTVISEWAQAKNMNSGLSRYGFADTTNTLGDEGIAEAWSYGQYTMVTYEVTTKFDLQYKYDYLELDREFPGDAFERHGVGFRYYFGPNMFTQWRVEKASGGPETEEDTTNQGVLDAAWAYMQVSF